MIEAIERFGARLEYEVGGEASDRMPLLLVHGWASNRATLADIAARFGTDRRVIVPDLRMHGASLAEPTAEAIPTTIPLLTDDLVAVLDAAGIDRVVAVGHSMAGQLVTLLAAQAPARVAGIVAVDPAYAAPADEIAIAETRRAEHVQFAKDVYRAAGRPEALESVYLRALADLYDSEYLDADSVGAIPGTGRMLAARTHPTLALYSNLEAAERERELSAVLPEIVVWPGSRHQLHEDHPAEFVALVNNWLDRHSF